MTIVELSGFYEVHPTQIATWKKQAVQRMSELFCSKKQKAQNEAVDDLYKNVGKLQVENE